jgi:hypothetical protein
VACLENNLKKFALSRGKNKKKRSAKTGTLLKQKPEAKMKRGIRNVILLTF